MKALLQIEDGEWWYKGCFIQKQSHPKLYGNYVVFADTEAQTHIGRTMTFLEAVKLAEENEVKEYKLGAMSFLK